MTGQVVVAGEALADLVPRLDGTLEPALGGGPFNTARTLGRLGRPTTFVGSVSRDRFGDQLAAALAADGVHLAAPLRTDRPTSLAMAELAPDGSASYRFYFAGTSAESLAPDVALRALPTQIAALHVGSLGLVLEPLADAVEGLVAQAPSGTLVMVDPNMRPSILGDPVGHAARLVRVFARADVVKVSDADLAILSPGEAPESAARALLAHGARLVLLTLGPRGAVALGAFGVRAVAAPQVAVVDTIGAGDIFSGAWLARWLELAAALDDGDAVQEATDFACRAAALSCSRRGASPPTRIELPAHDADAPANARR